MVLAAYATSVRECVYAIVNHRRLLAALAKRELSDEYVTHSLSIGWNFIHPLFLMLVYLFVFTKIFVTRITIPPSNGTDAVVYLLAGIIPWLAISQVLSRSAMSVVGNSAIVKQVSFPLELLPIKALAGPFMFAGVALAFLVGYGLFITHASVLPAYLLALPPLILITALQLAGLAMLLGALQVFFRDLKEIVNIFLTVGLFIHPILYLPNALPAAVRPIIYLSPFSYLIFCWQDTLFYASLLRPWAWAASTAFAVFFFAVGARIFVVTKNHFGDFL
jgi:lipopolysaccharide transport system permease protein